MVSAQRSCGQNRGRTPKLGSVHQLVPLSVPTASLLRGFGHARLSPGLLGCLAARLVCAQIQTPRQIHRAANPTAWGSQERQIQGLRGKVWYLCIENKEKIALIGVINPWKKTYQELLCVLYYPPFFLVSIVHCVHIQRGLQRSPTRCFIPGIRSAGLHDS